MGRNRKKEVRSTVRVTWTLEVYLGTREGVDSEMYTRRDIDLTLERRNN